MPAGSESDLQHQLGVCGDSEFTLSYSPILHIIMLGRNKWNELFFVFFVGWILMADFSSCSFVGENRKIRQKRNVICMFHLTGILKEAVYASLRDVPNHDPLKLGDNRDPKLKNGVLLGLSTFKNLTELEVYCNEDKLIVFTTTLGMRNAKVLYEWRRSLLFKFSGTVSMMAREVNFKLEILLNTTNGLTFKVSNTLLTKLKDFKFGFTGLGFLNSMISGIINFMYKIWKNRITSKIETFLKESLEAKLASIAHSFDFISNLG